MKTSTTQTSEFEHLTVLVVDNSELIRKLLSALLGSLGFLVLTARHGLEALARVSEEKPDVVLLDISMPTLDGYEVCKLIKSSRDFKNLPVVLVSSQDGLFDQAKGRFVGCDGYVTKPFTQTQMESVLRDVFSKGLKPDEPSAITAV